MKKITDWFTQPRRAYIYRVLVAIGLVLAGYGLITKEDAAVLAGLLTTVLNLMPTANTSTHPDQ